jgi:hypothetical protein
VIVNNMSGRLLKLWGLQMRRREFIARLGGALAAGVIGAAAVWRYVARAHRSDRVRAPRTVNRSNV